MMSRSKVNRALALFLAFAVLMTSHSSDARRRRHRRHRAKKRAVINEPELYQRMGGSKVVSELVEAWVKSAIEDGRLSGAFGADTPPKPSTLAKMKKELTTEVCELSDGPCKITDTKKLPESFALPEEKFIVFADHLVRSMDQLKIREREKNELLGRIGEVRVDGPGDAADTDEDETAAE